MACVTIAIILSSHYVPTDSRYHESNQGLRILRKCALVFIFWFTVGDNILDAIILYGLVFLGFIEACMCDLYKSDGDEGAGKFATYTMMKTWNETFVLAGHTWECQTFNYEVCYCEVKHPKEPFQFPSVSDCNSW